MALQPTQVDGRSLDETNTDDVFLVAAAAFIEDLGDFLNLFPFRNDVLGKEEARRQLKIVTRSTHCHRDASLHGNPLPAVSQADLQWFLHRQNVGFPLIVPGADLPDDCVYCISNCQRIQDPTDS